MEKIAQMRLIGQKEDLGRNPLALHQANLIEGVIKF